MIILQLCPLKSCQQQDSLDLLELQNPAHREQCQSCDDGQGAFAIYLEPWHADIFEFLDLRKNHGKEENRARDLFYALWIPDLFMERVQSNEQWSLFCPSEAPGLADCWGDEFKNLYKKYEREGKAKKIVSAQSLWFDILKAQIETGTPYMLYKDSCNRKSNQQNLGTIKSSNLCTEIIEYTNPTETAVCNLASIALPRFVREKGVPIESHPAKLVGSIGSKNRYFEFDKLAEITSLVTWNLNKIIDVNYYPVETARRSNMRHRPIGIGVQGLADTFILLGMPFESPEAQQLNKDIFETIYYHALKASAEIATKEGPYETYVGSPVSKEAYVAFNMMTEIGSLPTIETYNSLANVFAKGGLFQEAEAIFSRMTNSAGIQKNKDSFDALIEAYCQGSQLDDAVKAYMEMRKSRFNPDERSLEGVLNAYCIAGVIDESKEQFEEIKSDMTVPSIIAYCMMLSLYAKNDRWADAYDLLEEMKSYRDSNTHQVIASMIKGEYDDSSNWQMVEYVLDCSNLEGCDYSLRFFNALLDVLWWFGQKARAERVLEHAVNYGLFPELSRDTKLVWSLDVHRMSVGGALVAVSVWLNKLYTRLKAEKDLPQLASVVVLRGKMEKSTITRGLPIAKVVYSFLNDTLSSSFHYPKWNKGRIICLKSQLKKLQAAIDSSNGAAIPGFVHMTDSRLPSPGSKIYTREPQLENGSAHSTAESSVEEKESELLAL